MHACRLIIALLTIALTTFGVLMVGSLTFDFGDGGWGFVVKQLAALLAGGVAVGILHVAGIDWLRHKWMLLAIGLGAAALVAVTPYIGQEANNATRWIRLGPVSIQPAEIAKLALIVVLAGYCASPKRAMARDFEGIIIPLIIFGVYALLVYLTKDLGSVMVMGGILWMIMFFSGGKVWLLSVLGLLVMPVVAWFAVVATSWRYNRIMAFFDPLNRDIEATYHIRQSLITLTNGGTTGVGLGEGASRQDWLPERHTDFIFAVIGEEFGFIGVAALVVAYLMFIVSGVLVVNAAQDRFHRLLAAGVVALIGIQAFWNMMVVTGLAPTKGLTLPFISYGGSSLAVCLVATGSSWSSHAKHAKGLA